MTRKSDSNARYQGSILDKPSWASEKSWSEDNILTRVKRPKPAPACCCPPPEKNRLGGCKPILREHADGTLTPVCGTCFKELRSGLHKRRDQVHVIGLAALGAARLDVADLKDAGLVIETGDSPPASTTP